MAHLKIPATLVLVWDIKRALEKQQSLHVGIQFFIQRQFSDAFSVQFVKWWQQQTLRTNEKSSETYRFNEAQTCLVELIQRGASGGPIYESLKALEVEFVQICDEDIQKHVLKLPLLLQIPLLGLLFPAILILLIIPAVRLLQL